MDPIAQDLAFLTDETFGKRSPIDSVIKLEGMMRACKSQTDLMEWCLMTMSDLCLNREVRPAEMQPSWLFGQKGSQKGHLGIKGNFTISYGWSMSMSMNTCCR